MPIAGQCIWGVWQTNGSPHSHCMSCLILADVIGHGHDMTISHRPKGSAVLSSGTEADFSMCAMQVGDLIKVGDAVMLHMLPGDDAPRVARLQTVWSQVPKDGCERKFAQCCLFYRPSVCSSLTCLTSESRPRRLCMMQNGTANASRAVLLLHGLGAEVNWYLRAGNRVLWHRRAERALCINACR